MNEKDRQLSLALSSEELELVLEWLSMALVEGATLPPLDDRGRVDEGAVLFKAGQLSVLNKLRFQRDQMKEASNAT